MVKRVLQLTDSIERRNGRMSVVMNVYRKIDRSKIQFDFLVTDYGYDNYFNEITKLGGHVYHLSASELSLKNIRQKFSEVTANTRYDFIHYHALSKWGICISLAHKLGIPVIVHSHATKLSDAFIKSIRNRIFSLNILKDADSRVAVSNEAGKKLFMWQSFEYIPNMQDYSKFKYNSITRKKIRKQYGINQEDYVIGMVGRLAKQKNHIFALNLIKNMLDKHSNYKLLIVGEKDNKAEELEDFVKKNQLNDHVIFTGPKDNIEDFYSAFDIQWLPSLYEGLPTVGIEAQSNGLPLIVSNNISKQLKINNNVFFLPIGKRNYGDWENLTLKIVRKREKNPLDNIARSPYATENVMNLWNKLYGIELN